jgi:hypothetical protein
LVYDRALWDNTYGINVINLSGPSRIRLQSYIDPASQFGEAAVDLYNSQSQTVGRYSTTTANGVLFGAPCGYGNFSGSDGGYFTYAISSSDGYSERYILNKDTFTPIYDTSNLGISSSYWNEGYIKRVYGTASLAISASWAPMPEIPSADSASWASSSISASYAENSKTASYFYSESGSGAWHIYVEPTFGDLVFDYF